MFDLLHCSLHLCSQVPPFLLVGYTAATPFRYLRLWLGEIQVKSRISFARIDGKDTPAGSCIEMSHETFTLAPLADRNVLSRVTGDLHRFTCIRMLDLKIG